jgi:hypothetical protein
MQKWEYKIIDTQNAYHTTFTIEGDHGNEGVEGQDIVGLIPVLGEHGWELIYSHRLEAALFGVGQRFFFKRPSEK